MAGIKWTMAQLQSIQNELDSGFLHILGGIGNYGILPAHSPGSG